ncbi:MAG: TonB-dependent receptor plug domain-containing protein, partial [Bacteroidota bacterium]
MEDLLKTLPGVSSSNELSSNYSVRGGNFDENLVYINDFEIYRPLLIRAGQQEGISIIHPDMVDAIRFSAGGFDAMYGDRLSSVLDIRYKHPKKFAGSAYGSLLGGGLELENCSQNGKAYWMAGVRQKSNRYLLNTLETKGEYFPSFTDVQALAGLDLGKRWNVEIFGNMSRNRFNLIPENRETNFGTINDAKRFTVYFEGKEFDRYLTFTGAFSTTYRPSENLKLKLILSGYRTREEENFDILGQYFLDQLETDLGRDDFGDIAFNLGVGSFLSHARNRLDATVLNAEHRGERVGKNGLLLWGLKAQQEVFNDRMYEWNYNDSAGFSIPSDRDSLNPTILLNDVVITRNNLRTHRFSGFVQQSWEFGTDRRFIITAGIRGLYYSLNEQFYTSPRASITYRPAWDRKVNFRAAGGVYYQAPFYRELRDLQGQIYPETPAQKSVHAVIGNDFPFRGLGRNFKLTTEIYYKSLDVLIPYKIDNIRIRYLPEYRSTGYSTGIDLRLFGEFVKGTESWASLSVMKTQEDLQGDYYIENFNSDGEKIIPGYTFNDSVAYSVRVEPGFIPRPADQRVSFSLF